MSHNFPKKEKLKSKKVIERLFQEGRSLTKYPLRLIYLKTPLPVPVQVVVSVPSRTFKKAVSRNRIKRLMRESYRINKALVFNNTEGNFAFLFLYLGKEIPTFKEIDRPMLALLQQFIARKNDEDNSA